MTPAQKRIFAAVVAEEGLIRRIAFDRRVAERDVDDVVQKVLVYAWRRISRDRFVVAPNVDLRPIVRAWLRHFAFQEAGRARHARFAEFAHEEPLSEHESETAVDPIARIEAREALRLLTYRLNRREKTILAALAREDTMREIAALVDVEHATAGVLVFRLRKHLRRNLAR